MRAYLRAVREYTNALKDGKIAGPNADEMVAILTQYTYIKNPEIQRKITPAAIDPDGHVNLRGMRNDLAFYRGTPAVQDPAIKVERHRRHVVRRRGGATSSAPTSRPAIDPSCALPRSCSPRAPRRHAFEEAGEVVGDVIDVRGVAALELPVLAEHLAGVSGTTSTVVMPSACGTARLRARSSNMAARAGSTPCASRKRS